MLPKGLQNNTIPNPGQLGLNTQSSPTTLPEGFATIAENCVIDNKGRVASRKGREYVTTSGGTASVIEQIFEAEWADGTTTVFSVGAQKVYTGTVTMTDVTGAATITDDEWQIAQLQDVVYFFQAGHAPLQYDKAVAALDEVTAHSGYSGTVVQGTGVLSAFGRLWTFLDGTVYWTDLLNGVNWGGGSGGSLDMATVFPADVDTVVAIAEHNDFLVIFCKAHTLIYSGGTSPSTMKLQDTLRNTGCSARDTVVSTGQDILFLSKGGYRSLGRTIQEKSSPLGNVSKNVNDDLLSDFQAGSISVKAHYSNTNRLLILDMPSARTAYVFDTAFPFEDGALRVTTWPNITSYCSYELRDGTLLFGSTNGLMQYSTLYTDETVSYSMRLYIPHSYLGTPYITKVGKEIDVITEGGESYVVTVGWSYDWSTSYKTVNYTLDASGASEFGNAEFGLDEFGTASGVDNNSVKIDGSGRNVSLAVTASVSGSELAIQEINLHSIIGRNN